MAEFANIMHHLHRMCDLNVDGCSKCPLYHNPVCGDLTNMTADDIAKAEMEIVSWAKRHPEPTYPSWLKWLHEQLPDMVGRDDHDAISILLLNRVPADIAEKLGIRPERVNPHD